MTRLAVSDEHTWICIERKSKSRKSSVSLTTQTGDKETYQESVIIQQLSMKRTDSSDNIFDSGKTDRESRDAAH